MTKTVTESDLVLPALRALLQAEEVGLSTSDLMGVLREAMKPAGEDLEPLEGRNDDKFSQKVRNLKSHDRLERDDLAIYVDRKYYITEIGKDFVEKFGGVDENFSQQGFSEAEKKKALTPTKPLVFVEEGNLESVNAKVRLRSQRLRQYAMSYYSNDDGTISCEACGFEGTSCYGDGAKGLIEIHHKKPIAVAGSSKKPLREAVADVVPLCPNCHRMVHRRPGEVMSIEELQETIVNS
ncbi:HNH endonuclease [Cognatishimia sp. F0-27]|uniref:HNH endonuclease n=1 Tax=Cognatishimia sp. F0-27 TaxID=2816855 RepID=UPI001D0CA989|nr:HNH endonuclease [Cognatishimia sp. F0-27]MCC1494673.1 HNH endonuclease [Cognatishimia sp. F0-27]